MSDRSKDTSKKGKVLERLVASLHQSAPNVEVKTNVRLPTTVPPRRTREIDVLLLGEIAGYPIRVAIECKNHQASVDAPMVDAFVGKLLDVGIPSQCGIYVTAGRFTRGALARAKEAGLRTLVFVGLSADRLRAEVYRAMQSVVYHLPVIEKVEIRNEIDHPMPTPDLAMFHNDEGEFRFLPDLVWWNWIQGSYPTVLGLQAIDLTPPVTFYQRHEGRKISVESVSITVRILGFVFRIPGEATHIGLVGPCGQEQQKSKIDLQFENSSGPQKFHVVDSEESLERLLGEEAVQFRLLSRVRLPRIYAGFFYWPLSKKRYELIVREALERGLPIGEELFRSLDPSRIGDTTFEEVFDEIASIDGQPLTSGGTSVSKPEAS